MTLHVQSSVSIVPETSYTPQRIMIKKILKNKCKIISVIGIEGP
jgi:hypothetical protein